MTETSSAANGARAAASPFEVGVYSFADLTPMPQTGGRLSPQERMRNLIEEITLADQVGLDVYGLGEHHRPEYISNAPAVTLAAAATLTRHTRLQRAVTRLTSDDPVRAPPPAPRPSPPHERRHRALQRRSGPRLPTVRHPRPDLGRQGRDHGRPRLLHRVVPPLRLRAERLQRTLRGETGDAPRSPQERNPELERQAHPDGSQPRRLPPPRPGSAPRLGCRGRHPRIGRARRPPGPAHGDRHHWRQHRAVRAVRRSVPRGAQQDRPAAAATQHQLPRAHRQGIPEGRGHRLPGAQAGDGPAGPGTRLAAHEPPAVRGRYRRERLPRRRLAGGDHREDPLPARAVRPPALPGADKRGLDAPRGGPRIDRAARYGGGTRGAQGDREQDYRRLDFTAGGNGESRRVPPEA